MISNTLPALTSSSGSYPIGVCAILTVSPRSSFIDISATLTDASIPALSPSYRIINCLTPNSTNCFNFGSFNAVPSVPTTFLMFTWCIDNTSCCPSTTIRDPSLPICLRAIWNPYNSLLECNGNFCDVPMNFGYLRPYLSTVLPPQLGLVLNPTIFPYGSYNGYINASSYLVGSSNSNTSIYLGSIPVATSVIDDVYPNPNSLMMSSYISRSSNRLNPDPTLLSRLVVIRS